MAYKALYRTYRPTTFEEVAGQQHIVKTLKNALETGKISHAYLFCGPRGTGKTTMAKLVAKALNCEQGIGHQCNECENCKEIIEGNHPDVLEIDAASNRGINEIKELIEKVKYATALGRYKVFIIDEVHMMTTEAFNALLKTLEEPPEHVIFILATTEPYKLLPTILSRCQRYDFSRLSDNEIKDRIKIVLENENITYNDEAINIIVELADGGMRDALSMLDQVLAYSQNTLNTEDVLDIFSLESTSEKIALIQSIISNDVGDVLSRLNKYISKGSDIKRLTNDLIKILKDSLVYSYTANKRLLQLITEEDALKIVNSLSSVKINDSIECLMNTIKEYKTVSDINTTFEITLLKLCTIVGENTVKPQQKQETQVNKEVEIKAEPVVQPSYKQEEQKETVTQKTEPQIITSFNNDLQVVDSILVLKDCKEEDHYKIDQKRMIDIMVSSKKNIKNELLEKWQNIKKYTTNPDYGKISTMLCDAYPLVASNNMLVLEFPFSNLVEKANLIENQKALQTIIKNVFDKHMFVYSVSRVESVDYQKTYRNLIEVNRLPKAEDINLEFVEE